MDAIINTFSDAFLFFKGRYTHNSVTRLNNADKTMAMIEANKTGQPTVDTKSQNMKAANTYMPAAAIWKILVVLYTKANPIAKTEYRIPVMSPLMTNCQIMNDSI
jgi:hypothetical protein